MDSKPHRVRAVAESKARLSEIVHLAEEEGPQRIDAEKSFVVAPEHARQTQAQPRKPLGQRLVDNMPRGVTLEIPSRREAGREIPFLAQESE